MNLLAVVLGLLVAGCSSPIAVLSQNAAGITLGNVSNATRADAFSKATAHCQTVGKNALLTVSDTRLAHKSTFTFECKK